MDPKMLKLDFRHLYEDGVRMHDGPYRFEMDQESITVASYFEQNRQILVLENNLEIKVFLIFSYG
jgi:hypothetical protein